MNEFILKNGMKTIKFVISCGWCQLYFHDGSKELRLGANREEIIFSKLIISFLSLNNRNFFTYSGMKMFTIMNLMDSHAVIAGRESNDMLELLFLSTKGEIIPLVHVTDEIETDWITEIISFLQERNVNKYNQP